MPDDPHDILKAAGVECRALDEYQPFRNLTKVFGVIAGHMVVRQDKADAAILALARLVARYKWQRDEAVKQWREFEESDHMQSGDGFSTGTLAELHADLDRRWEEHRK